jgi:hypothetical protein
MMFLHVGPRFYFFHILVPKLKREDRRERQSWKKKQLKKGSISPIPIEKIEKLGVKVFLLMRRVPLRYLWASIWLKNVDHDRERVFH